VLTKSLVSQGIELASPDIILELAIPGIPSKLKKPVAKLRELLWRKASDVPLDSLDLSHIKPYYQFSTDGFCSANKRL
jgi:hypothetical protein